MKCDFIESPNKVSRTEKITAIIIHYTATLSLQSTLSWFLNPGAKVSAHYVISRDGRVVQMVKDSDVAWHAGKSFFNGRTGVNQFSIGIELSATATSGFTEDQMSSLEQLLLELIRKYEIPITSIVGHQDIAPGRKVDPGSLFDWFRIRKFLTEKNKCADLS
jgi:N-acetylmuramoyl-L-alanine amidase